MFSWRRVFHFPGYAIKPNVNSKVATNCSNLDGVRFLDFELALFRVVFQFQELNSFCRKVSFFWIFWLYSRKYKRMVYLAPVLNKPRKVAFDCNSTPQEVSSSLIWVTNPYSRSNIFVADAADDTHFLYWPTGSCFILPFIGCKFFFCFHWGGIKM